MKAKNLDKMSRAEIVYEIIKICEFFLKEKKCKKLYLEEDLQFNGYVGWVKHKGEMKIIWQDWGWMGGDEYTSFDSPSLYFIKQFYYALIEEIKRLNKK